MDWFEAARNGAIEALEEFLRNGQAVDQKTPDQRTALRLAAEHGKTAAVKMLLERGADANVDAPDVGRPLTAAVQNEHWETAVTLVRGGADPNADGVASIVIAAPPKKQLFATMLKHGLDPNGGHDQWGPYVQFALSDPSIADMLFDAGFDLQRYERETGESLLERALLSDEKRFHQLLKTGANVNLPIDRRTGQTLLMFLVGEEPSEKNNALISQLVKHGADVEVTDDAGRTAIDVARERGSESTHAWLLRLRDSARRAKEKAAEAARIAAEQEALRQKRSEIAKKAAEARRLAKEALQAKRLAAAKKAAATRAANKKAASRAKPKSKPKAPSKKPAKKPTKPKKSTKTAKKKKR